MEKVSSATEKKQYSNHRTSYSGVFKLKVIHYTEKHRYLKTDETAVIFGINKSMVTRRMMSKVDIASEAVKMHRKMMTKNRKPIKDKDLHAALLVKFKEARAKGHRVGFEWLWSKARQFRKEQTGSSIGIGKHVIVQFLKLNDIKARRKQRNKKKPE